MPNPMHLFVIDNYDSFTYNLVQLCQKLQPEPRLTVVKNDEVTLAEIEALKPDLILLSPGPGNPDEAGITLKVIEAFKGKIPLFGVCLGMQALAQQAGLQVIKGQPVHGKYSQVEIVKRSHPLFNGIDNLFEVVRYHSLCVEALEPLPEGVSVLASTCLDNLSDNQHKVVMAIETHPMACGVQFHPESIGSQFGLKLMENVCKMALVHHQAVSA